LRHAINKDSNSKNAIRMEDLLIGLRG